MLIYLDKAIIYLVNQERNQDMTRQERHKARKPQRDVLGKHWRNMLGMASRSDLIRPIANQPKRMLPTA